MNQSEQIDIQLSKTKLALMLLGCVVFVGSGIWFLIDPPQSSNPILGNPTVIFIVGLLAILFFGFIAFSIVKKLLDSAPGLIISDEGVMDNSSGFSAGFIPWIDVVAIKETRVVDQKFINIVVRNPQAYIDKQDSALKRKALQMNYNSYGTVVGISANGLKCNYDTLKSMLDNKFADFISQQVKD
jgi:hypothetical protein